MGVNICKNCGDEFTGEKQLCPACEVEKLRSGDLNAASKPGVYTVDDERKFIGKLEYGVEVKECKKCEYKLRCEECVYKNDEKSVINALKVIKAECKKYPYCKDCPLYEICDDNFGVDRPEKWKIPEQVKGEE